MKIALLCVAKNEEEHLLEFIDHYINLGITTIFFGDNNDVGNNIQYDVLKPYINSGKVQYYNYQGIEDIQHKFYTNIYFQEKDNYDWYCVFDCDEFLDLKNKFLNIEEFISQKQFKNTDVIFVKWEYRISEKFPLYHKVNLPYKELYTKTVHKVHNGNYFTGVKSIFRYSNNIKRVSLHFPFYKEGYKPILKFGDNYQTVNVFESSIRGHGKFINPNVVTLVHYFYKSCDEWVEKIFKGRGNGHKDRWHYNEQPVSKLICFYDKIIRNPDNNINLSEDEKKQLKTYLENQIVSRLQKINKDL